MTSKESADVRDSQADRKSEGTQPPEVPAPSAPCPCGLDDPGWADEKQAEQKAATEAKVQPIRAKGAAK